MRIKRAVKRKKTKITFSVISFIMVLLTIFICFVLPPFVHPTETNTLEYSATVSDVEIIDGGYFIYTSEHVAKLMIITKSVINQSELSNLKSGDAISFRIMKEAKSALDTDSFPYIVSLKTIDTDIITLNSFNRYLEGMNMRMRLTGYLFGTIFLLLGIHLALLSNGINIFSKKDVI